MAAIVTNDYLMDKSADVGLIKWSLRMPLLNASSDCIPSLKYCTQNLQLTSELADLGIDEVASPETDEIEREIKGLGLDNSDSVSCANARPSTTLTTSSWL